MKKFLSNIYIPIGITALMYLIMFQFFETPIYLYDAKFYDYFVKTKVDADQKSDKLTRIEEIVIIDIDNFSTQPDKLGKYMSWDFNVHAQLIANISKDNPKCIAFDVIIDPRQDSIQNRMLIDSVKKSNKVISALSFMAAVDNQYQEPDLVPLKNYDYNRDSYELSKIVTPGEDKYNYMDSRFVDLYNNSMANGSVVMEPDKDGVMRKIAPFVHYLDRFSPFLGLQMFIQGNDIKDIKLSENDGDEFIDLYNSNSELIRSIPFDKYGKINITYAGDFAKFRTISYYQAWKKGEVDSGFFKDKYVIVGSTLPGLYDLRATPVSEIYPGVAVHANLLNTIINSDYIYRLGKFTLMLLVFIFSFITCLIVNYSSLIKATFFVVIKLLVLFLTCWAIFDINLYIQPFPLILVSILSTIAMYAYKYTTEEKDKKMIKGAFSQFVNKKVVDDLLADPSKLKLGGEKKECSVFFSDVAGFTTISETIGPEALVKLLNIYLTEMTNIIFENDGMIDKYIGDAIMAVYGAPIATGNHAHQACRGAYRQLQRLRILRKELMDQGYPSVMARMGVNSGPMVVGNMGSNEYFNYTVMGDSVNLAARLEPANKDYDTYIMIGYNTYVMAKEFIYARQLDLMVVKGKTEPVAVFELFGLVEDGIEPNLEKMLKRFDEGYQLYLQRRFEEALVCFNECHELRGEEDGPSVTYVERCHDFIKNPPEDSWTGVYVKHNK